jgi:hypothetical protein
MEENDITQGVVDEAAALRNEVAEEVAIEEALLSKLSNGQARDILPNLIVFALIASVVVLIFLQSYVLMIWLIVGILLYSYNFIIILIPTTTKRIRPEEKNAIRRMDKGDRWLAFRLLMKKKRLAIEVGLTVFLGGMVPLAFSFSLIFGIGLVFSLYFGFVARLIDPQVVFVVVIQIAFILSFYVMMIALEPQAQGITRIAITYRGKIGEARSQGRMALLLVMMIIVAIVTMITVLALGAILLPGYTLLTIFNSVQMRGGSSILIVAFVTVAQLVIMRHFQGIASRRMAISLLRMRIDRLRTKALQPLDALVNAEHHQSERNSALLFTLRRAYYSIAIYDIIKQDIFGISPIYLVGPRLRYLMNDKVLAHFDG